MANDTKKVTFRAAQWSKTAARELTAIEDASASDVEIFRKQVHAGEWKLFDILNDGQRIGCVVWSVENDADGHSIIINAAAARPQKGLCVVDAIVEMFSALGKATGAHSLRCWTIREGLLRKLMKRGAKRRYVMEIDL